MTGLAEVGTVALTLAFNICGDQGSVPGREWYTP